MWNAPSVLSKKENVQTFIYNYTYISISILKNTTGIPSGDKRLSDGHLKEMTTDGVLGMRV